MEAEAKAADPAREQRLRLIKRITLGFYVAFIVFAAGGGIIGAAHGDTMIGVILGLFALGGLLLGAALVGSTVFGLFTLWRTQRKRR